MFKSLIETRVIIEYTNDQYTDNVTFFMEMGCERGTGVGE